MPLSLHEVVVPTWLQILNAARGWLDKAEAGGMTEAELAEARLIADMLPFAYQVKSMAVHSRGAIEGVRAGQFSPDSTTPPATLAGMKARLEETIAFLDTLDPGELESIADRPMAFTIRDRRLDFTVGNFLRCFSLPNFFFHAVTAYDILRMKGVEIGKRDFMGQLWLEPPPR